MRQVRGMKAAALLLAGSLALASCASDEEPSSGGGGAAASGEAALNVGLAYDTGGRGDKSFNDSAYLGVENAIAELGGEVREISPNADASDRADLLTQLADDGFDPVIAVGFAYSDVIGEVAEQYPDVTFAQVDGSVEATTAASPPANMTGLLFAANEGSFLGGVAAALKSQTAHVGFVGGVETPLIQSFFAGFEAGAKAVDPQIIVDETYISPAGDFSGFNDPARGQIVAQGLFDGGADIVYAAAGGSGIGVFTAAASSQKLAIGVDSDQYETVGDPALQGVIMTSVLKRVDNAVQAFLTDFAEGDVEGGTDTVNDLSTDGVGLSTSGGQIDDIQTQIDDYEQQIIDGEITVPE